MLRSRNFRPPFPNCTCTNDFILHPLAPSMSIPISISKEDMAEMYFVNYYESKNHKQRYKIKKLLYKAIGKCPI